jgi:hypothetical protein
VFLKYIVFSPYWNLPEYNPKEILPEIEKPNTLLLTTWNGIMETYVKPGTN